jgi:hypothetical protein
MNAQIATALRRIYEEERHRIVFWYDGEHDFEDAIADLAPDGVNILRLDQIGAMELKVLVELEDTEGEYLLYAPFHEPPLRDDWHLDIRLYSRVFRADRASIVLDELGLTNHALREHLAAQKACRGSLIEAGGGNALLASWRLDGVHLRHAQGPCDLS